MKNFFSSLFGFAATPWWIKITTAEPNCIYFFGPFESEAEALNHQPGFIEDLEGENAQQIETSLQRSEAPDQLTIELESSKQTATVSA